MRFTTKFSILICGLIVGCANSSFAASKIAENCDYYDYETASAPESKLQALSLVLPESSAIVICQTPRNVDRVFVLSPILNRDGVSFFRSSYFEIPAGSLEKVTNAEDLLPDEPILQNTMMALDPNAEMSHQSSAFVKTELISVGTFKSLYMLWTGFIEQPQKLKSGFDVSKLDDESKAAYAELIQSLSKKTGWKIYSLHFAELGLAEGDGLELEFSPRYIVNIWIKTQMWRIEFDMLDSQRFTLLSVELSIELIGAH